MQENTEEKRRALDRAFRSLAARAHTEKEIVEKLTRAGYSEEAIAGAMETLTRYRLVDDAAYAESWVSARAKRGIGPYRLQQELRRKGVSREDAQAALDTLDADDSLDAAASFAAKRLKTTAPTKSGAPCRRFSAAATALKPRARRWNARWAARWKKNK